MKTVNVILCVVLASLLPLPATEPSYEVHEWGTMTQVSGSDGVPLQWYQPRGDLAELPTFVGMNPFRPKSYPSVLLRMETPVLYFYPTAAMKATVSVSMDKGNLTEWYPEPAAFPLYQNTKTGATLPLNSPTEWRIELLPPQDKAAIAQIPGVTGGRGDHYAHAREVPDAWIVRSTHPTTTPEVDKFIFYRGAADLPLPVMATAPTDAEVAVKNLHLQPLPRAFVLRVANGLASWRRTDPLAKSPLDTQSCPIPQPTAPVETVIPALAEAVQAELTTAGLTTAEAAAMVATWKDAWFKEPGTRVLCLLPETWINTVLPLTLQPAPAKVKRVFVARLEVFPPAQEKALASLLDESLTKPGTARLVPAFQKLDLGRFGYAGLERAVAMKRNALESAYRDLESEVRKLTDSPKTAPSVSAR